MQLYEPSHGSRAKYDAFIRVWENEITCACMHASGWGLQVIKTVCPLWICKEHVPVELESQNREVCLACLWSKNQTSTHTRLTPCTTGHLRGETSKRATAERWDQPLLFVFSCFCIQSVCVCVRTSPPLRLLASNRKSLLVALSVSLYLSPKHR